MPLSSSRTAAFNSNEELRKQFFQEIGSADFRLPGFQETARSSLTRSAILAIYSLLVGRGAPDALLYPNSSSNTAGFPLSQETSIALRIARSTLWILV